MMQVRIRHSALDAESPNDNPLFVIRLRIKECNIEVRNDEWNTTCLL